MVSIKEHDIPGYEKVIEATDEKSGLHCFIAVHNTSLGPAIGGTRIYPYATTEEALQDVLRLAKAMTKKAALAELGTGGGKSVIIADPQKQKSKELLLAFGEAVDSLKGKYIAAEDVGSTVADMAVVHDRTPYVAAMATKKSSGDPSRYTAWGVFRGLEAISKTLWGNRRLKGKRIAIQGLGAVGFKLAEHLFWHEAELVVSDLDEEKVRQAKTLFGAEAVPSESFARTECDILSPCAMGALLNPSTIAHLKCRGIGGAANNQLLHEEDALLLLEKGILYAPDFIINSGGLINAAAEFDPEGYNPINALKKANRIYETLLAIFIKSEQEKKSTSEVAEELAEYNLVHGLHRRIVPIDFHL